MGQARNGRFLFVLGAIGIGLLITSCAAGIKGLVEPTSDESFVVVGSVFLVNNYYNERFEVYRGNTEVAIMGKIEEKGKEKIKGYWVEADENGYFTLADVPAGQYTLKGIRLALSTGELITISNPLRFSGSTFILQSPNKNIIIFDGTYFGTEAKGRVVNLQNNHFVIDRASDRTRHIQHEAMPEITDFKSPTGELLQFPRVEQYFIDKYPQSAWVPILTQSLETP